MSTTLHIHLTGTNNEHPSMVVKDYPDGEFSTRFSTVDIECNQGISGGSGQDRVTIFFKDNDTLVATLRHMRDVINAYLDEADTQPSLLGMGAHEAAIMGVINDILTPNNSKTV